MRQQHTIVFALVAAVAGCVADEPLDGELLDETAQAVHANCTVDYRIASQWETGFHGDVTIINKGTAGTGWNVTWRFRDGQVVSQAWNTSIAQTGTRVTALNTSWNGSLATGASANFGFFASHSGTNRQPTSIACTITP